MAEARTWKWNSEQQLRFLGSPADEALFGGAAGPSKTECLVMEALRQIAHPKYTAVIFRRVFPSLEAANGIIQRSLDWYPAYGGQYNGSKHYWTFPSGARIYFAHMQYEKDKMLYQGAEYAFVAFDELTEFEESQYTYMLTRLRAPAPGLRAYIRSATNPGNIGHAWVKERFVTRDIVNRRRWFATIEGKDTEVDRDHPNALSRAFYPARLQDNPDVDPGYEARILASGDQVQIDRLLHGDWDAAYTDGLIYDNWSTAEDGNVTAEAEYDPEKPLYWACDDGYVYGDGPGYANYHPRIILFVQDNDIGGLDVIDELVETHENPSDTVDRALNDRPYRRPSMVYVPGDAAVLRGEITKQSLHSINATHRVSEGIKVVRALIQGGDGIRRVRVHPRCQHFIYEFGHYRNDLKGRAQVGELIPLKVDDHTPDAFRYIAYHRRRVS